MNLNLTASLSHTANVAEEITTATERRIAKQRDRRAEIDAGCKVLREAMHEQIEAFAAALKKEFDTKLEPLERMLLADVDEVIQEDEAQLAKLKGEPQAAPQPARVASNLSGRYER